MTRWNRRLLLAATALLVPLLAGCEAGFDAPTLEFHPANNGANTTQNGINIVNAFVLGPRIGFALPAGARAGVFFSIVANNGDRLLSVSAPGAAAGTKITGGPVNAPAQTVVGLSGPVPQVVLIGLKNPLTGGEAVTLIFNFAIAGPVTLAVPVQARAYAFATYSPPAAPNASPSARPTPTSVISPKVSPGPSGTASASVGGATASSTPTP